jgi:hypothetical protein
MTHPAHLPSRTDSILSLTRLSAQINSDILGILEKIGVIGRIGKIQPLLARAPSKEATCFGQAITSSYNVSHWVVVLLF